MIKVGVDRILKFLTIPAGVTNPGQSIIGKHYVIEPTWIFIDLDLPEMEFSDVLVDHML